MKIINIEVKDLGVELKSLMVKELYEGVPSMSFEKFLEQGNLSLNSIREQAGKINLSNLWKEALDEVRTKLKLEITDGISMKNKIEDSLSSFKFQIPFLFKSQQESLELKRVSITNNIANKKLSISNAINYYETLKIEINHVQKEIDLQYKQETNFLNLSKELSTKHGLDIINRNEVQTVLVVI